MEDISLQGQIAELKRLTEENNRILKAMRRDALIAGIVKFVIWAGLLGLSYYFAMQIIGPFLDMTESMQNMGQGQDFGALFEQYRGLLGQ